MQCFDGLSRPKGGFGGSCTLVGALEHRCKRLGMALTLSKPLSANMTETPAPLGITVGRWR